MQDYDLWVEYAGAPSAIEKGQIPQDFDLKRFLHTYENCTALWNINDKYYMNKEKRNEDLEKLLVVFKKMKPNATLGDVKKKLNSLRSNYRKELRKIELSKRSGCDDDNIYRPTSTTFYALRFLDKVETPMSNKDGDFQDDNSDSLANSPIPIEEPSPKIVKKTKIVPEIRKDVPVLTCNFPCQPIQPSQVTINPLALVWTEKLSLLTPMQRLYAEKAINDVLFEAQLNNLDRNSVQIHIRIPSPTEELQAFTTQEVVKEENL